MSKIVFGAEKVAQCHPRVSTELWILDPKYMMDKWGGLPVILVPRM